MGFAHYTYKIVARRFTKLLTQHGIAVEEIDYPEMYDASRLPHRASTTDKPLHLIFKPTEEIRILRGAYNVGIVYWEFDKITTSSTTGNPSSNQFRMLSLLDEISVANRHLKQVLADAGLRNVHYVPCPVETAEPRSNASRLQNWLGDAEAGVLQFDGWPMTSMASAGCVARRCGHRRLSDPSEYLQSQRCAERFRDVAARIFGGRTYARTAADVANQTHHRQCRDLTRRNSFRNFRNWKALGSAHRKNIVLLFENFSAISRWRTFTGLASTT